MTVWVFPMAGRGERVATLGGCKPVIDVAGRPVLGWCLTGLRQAVRPDDRVVGITTVTLESQYEVSGVMQHWMQHLGMPNRYRQVLVADTPPGPAATVFAGRDAYSGEEPIVVVNVDQYCVFEWPASGTQWDGFLPLYVDLSGASSYVVIEKGEIVRIREKEPISWYASSGVYGFRSGDLLVETLEATLRTAPHVDGEYFVGPAMNLLVDRGGRLLPTRTVAKFNLGSVDGIRAFVAQLKYSHG